MPRQIYSSRRIRLEEREYRQKLKKRNKRIIISILIFILLVFLAFLMLNFLGTKSFADVKNNKSKISYNNTKKSSNDSILEKRKIQKDKFSDITDVFLVTSKDTKIYFNPSKTSPKLYSVPKDTYLETFGEEKGWTLVDYSGKKGYIASEDLTYISNSNYFKVVSGILVIDSKYCVPDTYITKPSDKAVAALNTMLESAVRDNINLEVSSNYRTPKQEADELIYRGNIKDAPKPGHSSMQSGFSVEFYSPGTNPRLENNFNQSKEYQWLKDNAYKFGFIERYPKGSQIKTGYREDPTIWRYVGIDIAKNIHDRRITLEEYLGL